MLKKLLKHDLLALRFWLISYAITILLALAYGFTYSMAMKYATTPTVENDFRDIGILWFMNDTFNILCLSINFFNIIGMLVFLFSRYYIHYYTNRGYLMLTLPAKSKDLFLSKFLSGFIGITSSLMVLVTSGTIIKTLLPEKVVSGSTTLVTCFGRNSGVDFTNYPSNTIFCCFGGEYLSFKDLPHMCICFFNPFFDSKIPIALNYYTHAIMPLIISIPLLIVTISCYILLIYAAISIGQRLFKNYKLLGVFIATFTLYIIQQIVVATLVYNLTFDYDLDLTNFRIAYITLAITIIVNLFAAIIYAFISHNTLKKHINLS